MAAHHKDDVFSRRYSRQDPWLKNIGYFRKFSFASCLAAVVIGLVQMYILVQLWGYLSLYTPIPHLFRAFGLRGSELHLAVFLSDALSNFVFCLPAAYALCRLRPSMLVIYLILAIAPGFIWQYQLLIMDPPPFNLWTLFVPGVLLTLLPLPVAALAVRCSLSRHSPNQRLGRP